MRIKEVKGIVNDLLDCSSWRCPLNNISIGEKYEINLISGKLNRSEEDSLTEYLREKRDWFVKRVESLKGDLKDFESAKIICFGVKEKVEVVYKGKKFENETIFENFGKGIRELREGIKNMKAEEVRK